MWNALLMACLRLFLGSISVDPLMAMPRFTLNAELTDNVGLVPIIMGLFDFQKC
jgi:TctA family transporter